MMTSPLRSPPFVPGARLGASACVAGLLFTVAVAGVAAATHAGAPSVVYAVGNVVPMPPGAIRVARLIDVPWASLPPGADVTIAPGTQAGPVMINARGSAAQPITVHASQSDQPPVLTSSLDFQHASHVKISHLVVDGSPWAAVVIRQASDHITIEQSTLSHSAMGLNITEGAGTGHVIRGNLVTDNATSGIGVDMIRSDPLDPSRIVGNTVLRSGHHGMEIRGSNYLIDHNTTALNGQTMPGISGIHIYSGVLGEGTGSGNLIRYNFSYANIDRNTYDGNGIEIDQFCDHNEVSFNVVWGNDGAGIAVFDAADNQVFSNTAFGNGVDSGHTHVGFGEIILNSGGAQTNRSRGNAIYDNLLVATRASVPALYVDAITTGNANAFGPNLYQHRAGGALLDWGDNQLARTAADVDRLSGSVGALAEAPAFANESAPLSHGLRLIGTPTRQGNVFKGRKDMQGVSSVRTDSFFGAYFTPPGL